MRIISAAGILLGLCAGASAQAVGEWHADGAGSSSIDIIRCTTCVTRQAPVDPALKTFTGGMISETRIVGGEEKVFRIDNMLGGSPVATVASPALVFGTPETTANAKADEKIEPDAQPAAIDRDATTAAVAETDTAFSPDAMQLRLN
ncbi:hypothetical protein [Pararhizobium haloflavum]|uniref:hypothetical protein n=1 Tax=Pararhizobium haloflavum TaxID=2037914 RepID=UPI0012FFD3E3|nr:hypothetical protein [Pararhizobium haloflavum]